MLFVTNDLVNKQSREERWIKQSLLAINQQHQDQRLEYLQGTTGMQDRDVLKAIDVFFVDEMKE